MRAHSFPKVFCNSSKKVHFVYFESIITAKMTTPSARKFPNAEKISPLPAWYASVAG